MISLIASDLDGTLLTADKTLPDETFELIEALYKKGVLFAPASGRQYANLKKLFAPVADKVIFIAENGALVVYRDKILFEDTIPPEEVMPAVREIRKIDGLYPMLCTADYSYIESMDHPFSDYAFASYTHCKYVEDLESVASLPILKIAIHDRKGSAINCMKRLPEKLPRLRTMISGFDWTDVSSLSANKGEAIRFIREKFRLHREDCVAFGDHMNDFEMLQECGQAFVPENAYHTILETFPNHIPSAREFGTIQKCKEILKSL
ncbi:MAG: HAD family hydrolase [Clostridia bacterium]|nr:HAD family hydrolase [Clostridia bacterium]